jgi:hypothetical protein
VGDKRRKAMRALIAVLLIVSLSGCASYFTARPPVIEDKVGLFGKEKVGTLATAPDYRVVYVKIDDQAKLCAEAPADAGAQFGQFFAAALSAQTGSTPPLSVEAKAGLAVAMKQLFKRSQGIQLYRDGSFALCNLFLNGGVNEGQYLAELQELRKIAAYLIEKEIPFLEKVTIDPIAVPVAPTPPDVKN